MHHSMLTPTITTAEEVTAMKASDSTITRTRMTMDAGKDMTMASIMQGGRATSEETAKERETTTTIAIVMVAKDTVPINGIIMNTDMTGSLTTILQITMIIKAVLTIIRITTATTTTTTCTVTTVTITRTTTVAAATTTIPYLTTTAATETSMVTSSMVVALVVGTSARMIMGAASMVTIATTTPSPMHPLKSWCVA
jgi:hypothetical protein